MRKFRLFDHAADLGLLIVARSMRDLFATAPRGLTALHTDIAGVRLRASRRVVVEAPDRHDLLVRWLKEWLFLQNEEGFLVAEVKLERLSDTRVIGRGRGELRRSGRHPARREIKAVTYSGAAIERGGRNWRARLILDV